MPRGNPDNLRAAAQRKHDAAIQRADSALRALEIEHAPITFRGVAKAAAVSVDFLYRSPLRDEIMQLRAYQQTQPPTPRRDVNVDQPPSQSAVVRTLTAQLAQLRSDHRAELARLEASLAAAHGENLQLRRCSSRAMTPSHND